MDAETKRRIEQSRDLVEKNRALREESKKLMERLDTLLCDSERMGFKLKVSLQRSLKPTSED